MNHFEIKYEEADDGMFDPMLEYPQQPTGNVGKYGGMRLQYLQRHRKTAYGMMRLEGTLKRHLLDVNDQAHDMVELLINQMLINSPAPDKATDPLGWAQHMNSLKAQAEEVVCNELIFA